MAQYSVRGGRGGGDREGEGENDKGTISSSLCHRCLALLNLQRPEPENEKPDTGLNRRAAVIGRHSCHCLHHWQVCGVDGLFYFVSTVSNSSPTHSQ